MIFANALAEVAKGKKVTRAGWKNITMCLCVWQAVVGVSEDDGPVFGKVIGFPYTVDGETGLPVTMAPEDMLASDWEVAE